MAVEIVMPKLAMAMKQGKVVEWKVNEGERVEKGQIVMVIETEKVSYEVESPALGFLHIQAELDKTVPVNEIVALLAETKEELAELQAAQPAPQLAEVKAAAAAPAAERPPAAVAATAAVTNTSGKVKISPLARKIAGQHNLDITQIPGSGPSGRIKKRDVLKVLEEGVAIVTTPAEEVWSGETIDGKRVKATIALKGMRKAISEHMVHSLTVAAQLSYMGEMDMTALIELRKALLTKEEEIGTRITYTDLLVYALVKAVKHVPLINSSLVDNEIKIWEDINVGVAVALDTGEYESGLIVPVVKNAGKKSLVEISKSIKELIEKAREGQLTLDDVTGGTITISNTGGFAPGWTVSTPVLNQPESVIVQPGGIFEKPWNAEGKIELRPIMSMSITFDHRVMDGVPIGRFYTKMMELVQQPEYLHL
jgi:pyruvate dehydrogenase E2 component (dihydrolipoamide acetyltransferase)/2-oxoglutarate dehydrogenase E2 component (dihydrolipoamide succinyltransferase)